MSVNHFKRIHVIVLMLPIAMMPLSVSADVLLDKSSQLKLFGDVRYRYENDERSDAVDAKRTQSLIRARIGTRFQPAPAWAGNLRLSTDSTSPNSRDTTQSTTDTKKNGDFGLDQAYVTYSPSKAFNMFFGKTDFVFFQQGEALWDRDISPESIAVVIGTEGLSLNATQITLLEGDWQKDVTADAYQLVYTSGGVTFAYGQVKINRHEQFTRDTNGDGFDDAFG